MKVLVISMIISMICAMLFASIYHIIITFGWLHFLSVAGFMLWFSILAYILNKLDKSERREV